MKNQSDPFSDCVQLMTLHSVKGLEFPVVFLTGMEDGLFPHRMSMETPNGLEEERRLCYVGITRAMQKLYLTYSQMRRLYGYETKQYASRFLKEIPEEYIESVRIKIIVSKPIFQEDFFKTTDTGIVKLGQMVKHSKFGQGIVLKLEGNSPRTRVQIQFRKFGTKWLILELAKLSLV